MSTFSRVRGSVPRNVTGVVEVPRLNEAPEMIMVGPVAKCPIAAVRFTSSKKLATGLPEPSTAAMVMGMGTPTVLSPTGIEIW